MTIITQKVEPAITAQHQASMVRILRPRQDGEQRLNNVQSYHALGFNVLALDSHKKPLTHWKSNPDWATTRQTVNDVNHMPWGKARQIAAICGAASGYLICADFDKQPDRAVVDEFLAAFKLLPDYAWCEATPGGGYHVWVKSLDLIPPYDARGGKVDRAGRLAGHIELRFEGVLTTLYFEQVPDCPPATVSGSQLLAAYEQVTKPPEPKSVPDRAPYTAPDLPTDSRELEEVEQRARAAIANSLIKRGGRSGYYACPLEHGCDGKDFLFNPEPGQPIGGCQGKHAGLLTRWVDLAESLGIDVSQIAREVAAERRRAVTFPKTQPERASDTILAGEIPHTIGRRLIEAKLHNALLVWHNRLEQGALTRRTYDSGIEQLSTLGVIFVQNETPISDGSKYAFQNVQNSGRGRPARVYTFYPLDVVLDRLEAFFVGRARAVRYQEAPSDVQPDFADPPLSEMQCAALDAVRAGVYDDYGGERQVAEMERTREVDYIRQDFARIRRGAYQVFDLPDGITKATDLRRVLYERKLDENPDGIESYKLRKAAGISRTTQSRYRQQYGTITIPQHHDILVLSPDDIVLGLRQTAELIAPNGDTLFLDAAGPTGPTREFLALHPGSILRKTKPSIEKRREKANQAETDAYTRYTAQQRRRAAGKASHESQSQQESDVLLPTGYSSGWLLKQFNWTSGADRIPWFDAETGEVYTIGQRWKLLGEKVSQTDGFHVERDQPD